MKTSSSFSKLAFSSFFTFLLLVQSALPAFAQYDNPDASEDPAGIETIDPYFEPERTTLAPSAAGEPLIYTLKLASPKTRKVSDSTKQSTSTLTHPSNSSTGRQSMIGTYITTANKSWFGFRFKGLGALQSQFNMTTAVAELELVSPVKQTSKLNINVYGEISARPEPFSSVFPPNSTKRPLNLNAGRFDVIEFNTPTTANPSLSVPTWEANQVVRLPVSQAFRSSVVAANQDLVSLVIKGNSTFVKTRKFFNEFGPTVTPPGSTTPIASKPRLRLTLTPKAGGAAQVRYLDLASPTRTGSDIANESIGTTGTRTFTQTSTTVLSSYIGTKGVAAQTYLGIRFGELPAIPAGYAFGTAKLRLKSNASQGTSKLFSVDVFAEKKQYPEFFANLATNPEFLISSRVNSTSTLTSASVSLSPAVGVPAGTWSSGKIYEFDVTAPVRELMQFTNAPSLVSLLFRGKGAINISRTFYNDQNATNAPTLVVTYVPSGVTPPPTPTPPVTPPPLAPVCSGVSMSSLPGAPTLGSQVSFTCGQSANATSYQFRYKVLHYQTGAVVVGETPLAAASAGSRTSVNLNANQYGNYKVQCVPCNSVGCAAWETPW